MVKPKGRLRRKSKRIERERGEDENVTQAPHSIVIHRGHVPPEVKTLVQDYRMIMSPYTAEDLKVRKYNSVKDFVHIAPYFHVTHLVMFTKNESAMNMKICRLPRGPSLYFKVEEYSLIKDLTPTIKNYTAGAEYFHHHSLLVMNNFNRPQKHLRLVSSMFQNMFPSINVTNLKVKRIKRVTLVTYDDETDLVEIRHYAIRVVPYGISRPVSKMLKRKVPDLSQYKDVSDFLLDPGALSESEAEFDGDHNTVEELQVKHKRVRKPKKEPKDVKDEDIKEKSVPNPNQSAIRLTEIGPRLTLSLYRIEGGLLNGDVLYNKFVSLTEKEKAELKARHAEKMKLKMQRRQQQEENIKKKKIVQKAVQKAQKNSQPGEEDEEDFEEVYNYANEDGHVDDDDEYFREEVGKKPEKGLFPNKGKNKPKQRADNSGPAAKRRKTDGQPSPKQRGKSKWKLSDQNAKKSAKSPNTKSGRSPMNKRKSPGKSKPDKSKSKASFTGMSSGSMGKFIRKKAKK